MGIINYVIGFVTAVLVLVGVKRGNQIEKDERKGNIQISTQHGQIKKKFDSSLFSKNLDNLELHKSGNAQSKHKVKILLPLDYEKYSEIRFKPEYSFWRENSKFQLQFFPQGYIYNDDIKLNEVWEGYQSPIFYQSSYFSVPQGINKDKFNELSSFTGFRLLYPINSENQLDEFIVFQGASYFRSISKGHVYGLSARGIAINTGLQSPEEFPIFKEFWIEKPKPKSEKIVIHSHLEGNSIEGYYKFVVHPGDITKTEISFESIIKKEIEKFGIAPLTSMFWYGESNPSLNPPYPESHDSDGLLIHDDQTYFWIPLENPKKPISTSFKVKKLKGFGLLQRDREFSSYEDTRYEYQKRPGAWVEPTNLEDWEGGTVSLYRIPTQDDLMDNIVVYYTPEKFPIKGDILKYSYNIKWIDRIKLEEDQAEVTSTRVIHNKDKVTVQFLIDLKGLDLKNFDEKDYKFIIEGEDFDVLENSLSTVNNLEKLRVTIKLSFKSKIVSNSIISGYLVEDLKRKSETWKYILD
jgi:periplasmic glucans biosynthesis protein